MRFDRVCLLGGTGFVGRHLTYRLAKSGVQCRILTRRPHRHRDLLAVPGVEMVEVNVFDVEQLGKALQGCDAVVNLVGILNENRRQKFRRVHVELAEHVITASRTAGIKRLLHMSALSANESGGASSYLRTKGEGENRSHTLGRPDIAVTSFRPSVIFGRDDSFVNRFASLLKIPGPLPLACPNAQFAPVFIGDLVAAMAAALNDRETIGRRLDLCGPDRFSLAEIVQLIAGHVAPGKRILQLSDGLSRLQAAVLQFAPGKPFTPDNYQSLQQDSVCDANCLDAFGIEPTSLPRFLNAYLGNESRQARLSALRGVS